MFRLITSCLLVCFALSANAQNFIGESVEYDPDGNRFFTSSDGTSIIQRAANGDISYFGDGLRASYGMEVMNGRLYAIDGNTIYEYDLFTELEISAVTITGSQLFLNGMASDASTSRVWVTDFSNNRIHEISYGGPNPSASIVVNNTSNTPNGIWHDADSDRLLFVTWQQGLIRSVDLANGYALATELNVGVNNIDGIDENGQGELFLSSWSPNRITKVSSDFSTLETITVPGISSPADICYALEIDTLAIPSSSSTMKYVGFIVDDIGEEENTLGTTLFPNPTGSNSMLRFELDAPKTLSVRLFDMSGVEVKDLGTANYPVGANTILIVADDLAQGQYFIQLSTDGLVSMERMIVVD